MKKSTAKIKMNIKNLRPVNEMSFVLQSQIEKRRTQKGEKTSCEINCHLCEINLNIKQMKAGVYKSNYAN